MVNLDGFALTHTYETVEVPSPEQADAFLPPYQTKNRFDFEHPTNIGFSAGPEYNRYFKYQEHQDLLNAPAVIEEVEQRFAQVFGRRYPGLVEAVQCEDADYVLVTLGSAAAWCAPWWSPCGRRACAWACCASATCGPCRRLPWPPLSATRRPWPCWKRTCRRSVRKARCSPT